MQLRQLCVTQNNMEEMEHHCVNDFNPKKIREGVQLLQRQGRFDISKEIEKLLALQIGKSKQDTALTVSNFYVTSFLLILLLKTMISFKDQSQHEPSFSWKRLFKWIWHAFLILVVPIRICGLYYADIISDILQSINLRYNCHYDLFGLSLGIVVTSYVTTTIYLKFQENLEWSRAIKYPYIYS